VTVNLVITNLINLLESSVNAHEAVWLTWSASYFITGSAEHGSTW